MEVGGKKNDLIRGRKHCKIFRFIDDLNSINNGGEFELITGISTPRI